MGLNDTPSILSELTVREAMRNQLVHLPQEAPLSRCIRYFLKYKVSALLAGDPSAPEAAGVVSKTDIMGAYYAGLPLETALGDIMSSPPLFCASSAPVEEALETMRARSVYRLFVKTGEGDVTGVIAYPDIVGMLYHICCDCRFSRRRRVRDNRSDSTLRLTVGDVMTTGVKSYPRTADLIAVMEGLSAYRFGAVLIADDAGAPAGVLSKSDLVTAYLRGVEPALPAETVMSSPVTTCDETEYLENAIQSLIFSQIQRIFVHRGDPRNIVGVLSLSDAARIRSGSCHACTLSRIRMDDRT